MTAILFLAVPAVAQVRENITVTLIEVPVTVVDGGGNPVRGLTAANFEIYDRGKKQQITSLDTIDFGVRGVAATAAMNPAARRSFMLLFDLGYSSPSSLQHAQDAARRFVKQSVQPRDLVGVGTIDIERGFHLLAAFTTDRELVAAAIDNPGDFRGADPLQIANQRSWFDRDPLPNEELLKKPGESPGQRPQPGAANAGDNRIGAYAHLRDVSNMLKRETGAALRKRLEKQMDALGDLARALASVAGRKQLIYLSEGFDASLLQGRSTRSELTTGKQDLRDENEQLMEGNLYNVDSEGRFGNSAGLTTLDRMAGYFRSSDVVLHAIDIKGIRVQNTVTEGMADNSNAGLFTLARPTGGLVFENANSMEENFARLLHAQEVVYVLGFQAASVKPGMFHELKVKVVGASAAHVSHRAGYVETDAASVAEKLMTDAEIVVNDVPQRDIRVAAMTAAIPADPTRAEVPIVLEINGADLLQTPPKDGNAMVEVYVYAFDRDGVVRDRLFEKMRLDMAKAGDRLRNTGAKFIGMLMLPPGEYAVKSLVRVPGSERRGFARTDVRVPAAGEIAATPFFVDQQPRDWVIVRGTTVDPQRFPFQVGGESLMPSAAPKLRKGEPRRFALFVAGAGVDELKVDAALGPGKAETPRMVAQDEGVGMAKLVFDCDTAGLDAGPAALRIVVHRNGTNDLKATLPLVVSQ